MENESAIVNERRIMAMMRQVLTSVARDTAPAPGKRQQLSDQTIQNIKECLYVISCREQELAAELGKKHSLKPRFADESKKDVMVPSPSTITKPTTE